MSKPMSKRSGFGMKSVSTTEGTMKKTMWHLALGCAVLAFFGLAADVAQAAPKPIRAISYYHFAALNTWATSNATTGIEYEDGYGPSEDYDEDGLNNNDEYLGWKTTVNGVAGWYTYCDDPAVIGADPFLGFGPDLGKVDTECDGIADYWEEHLKTDPTSGDTDGDTLPDAWETWVGLNALEDGVTVPDSMQNPMMDPDGDGLTSAEEYVGPGCGGIGFKCATTYELTPGADGGFPYATLTASDWTSPINFDTDSDELIDSFEYQFGDLTVLNPRVKDDMDADPDKDGLTTYREMCTHPLLANFWTGTGIPALSRFPIGAFGSSTIGHGAGSQGMVVPGYMNLAQFSSALNTQDAPGDVLWGHPVKKSSIPCIAGGVVRWTSPRSANSDGDGLPDGWELEHGLNPLNAGTDGVENLAQAVSGALGDPDADTLYNMQEYFGADGYRIDFITGTGDESNPWIARIFNHPARSEFARLLGQASIGGKKHQAPVGYGLDFIASYGAGPYYGFFDPTALAGGTYEPIPGVPPFVLNFNDETYLGLDPGSFQPFATAITGLSWFDQDLDSFFTPGLDPVWLAVTDPEAYTPGDPILDDYYLLQDGVPAGGSLPQSGQPTDLRYFDDDSDAAYTPGVDSVWLPVGAPNAYSVGDPILFDGGALAAVVAPATLAASGSLPANTYYNDADGNAAYTPLLDPVWLDDDGDFDFTQADAAALPPVAADTIVDDVGLLETAAIAFPRSGPLTDAISTIWPMPGTDTDDDGWPDALEIQADVQKGKYPSSPVQSHSPLTPRSALLTTDAGFSPNLFEKADSRRFFGRDFTVETWVYLTPEAGNNNFQGSLIRGDVVVGVKTAKAFDLGLMNVNGYESVPYVTVETLSGYPYTTTAARSLPYGQWIHLAGVFDHKRNTLSLYINGLLEQSGPGPEEGAGKEGAAYGGTLVLGKASGLPGTAPFANRVRMDEVRIWGAPRLSDEIADNRLHLIDWTQLSSRDIYTQVVPNTLLAYYSFDDGGRMAEDLVRRAKSSLLGYDYPHDEGVVNFPDQEYLYGDQGFAIPSDNVLGPGASFSFDANNPAPVIGALDGERGEFDSDRDGLPDAWEIVNEFNPFKFSTPDHDQLLQYDPAWGAREPILIARDDLVTFRASADFGVTWTNSTAGRIQTVVGGVVTYVADPAHVIIGDYETVLVSSNEFNVVTEKTTNWEIRVVDVSAFLLEGETWYVSKTGTPISRQAAAGQAVTNEIVSDALRDMELPTGDGLNNQYEYWAHTNPRKGDSDADGIADGEEDFDGDGLANRLEAYLGSRPDLRDTDDDSLMDSIEQSDGSSPIDSVSPAKSLALYLDGNPGSYLEMSDRHAFRLASWTVEAKVLPADLESLDDGQGVSIVRRVVQDTTNNMLAANFDLRVVRVGTNLTPEIRYIFATGTGNGEIVNVRGSPTSLASHRLTRAVSPDDPYPTAGMTHLAATFNDATAELKLYMNGALLKSQKFGAKSRPPQSGKGSRSFVRIGEGFEGFVDDVRIWSAVRTEDEIYNNIASIDAGAVALVAMYKLDDGGWPAMLVKGSVIASQASPPAIEPTLGDRYRVTVGAGDWAGQTNSIAEYTGFAWKFYAPTIGMRVWDAGADEVREYDGTDWVLAAPLDPTIIRGVDYPSAAAAAGNEMESVSWLEAGEIITVDSGLLKTSPAPAKVFCEGAMVGSDPTPDVDDFAWWTSKSEYYRWDGFDWIEWGPALRWLAPARLKADGLYVTEISLLTDLALVPPAIGDRFIVVAESAIYTAMSRDIVGPEDFAIEPLNAGDRVLFLAPYQAVGIWDGATLATVATAGDLGGDIYIHVRSEGIAYKSDGAVWARWGMIPTSEDSTAAQDWNNQWRNAARLSGFGSFRLLDGVTRSLKDTDGDGLPDDWEVANNLDPNDPNGINGAAGDPDGDGLSNLNEYLLGYDPWDDDTNDNGLNDGEEDFDRDGLPNWYEQEITKSRLDQPDTDDDGLTDYAEAIGKAPAKSISSPIWSLDPPVRRSMEFMGNSRLTVESQKRHHLQSWTVMAWVKPSEFLADDCLLIRRTVKSSSLLYTGPDLVNYELGLREVNPGLFAPYVRHVGLIASGDGLSADVPAEAVTTINTNNVVDTAGGHQATGLIAAGEWFHLAGSYDAEKHTMSLYINGELSVYRNDVFPPSGMSLGTEKTVLGPLTIGGGEKSAGIIEQPFWGWMDDVKVLGGALAAAQIKAEAAGEIATGTRTINQAVDPQVRQLPISEALQYEHTNKYILVRFKAGVLPSTAATTVGALGLSINRTYQIAPIYRLELQAGDNLATRLADLRNDPNVLYAEPDYIARTSRTPNDPLFNAQWALKNDGSMGGVPGADISATEAWSLTTGNNEVIIAVIDTGVDYTHLDLADNMWINEDEIPDNGVDDDKNGYIDDVHGWNFSYLDEYFDGPNFIPNDPMDRNGHGTHCAGIIGAVGNNGAGVAGVNWKVKIMPISFLGQYGMGLYSDAILAIEYAWKNGARISNNSWGGMGFSQSLYDAIQMAGLNGHLVAAAAGNYTFNNDSEGGLYHFYPSDFDLPNVVSVAATDRNDELAEFSNYGAISVDLAAPGVSILSTLPNNNYANESGTSMACPFVAGAAALLLGQDASRTVAALKRTLMQSVDPLETLTGKVVTGGRLNLAKAVGAGGSPVLNLKFDDGGGTAEDFTKLEDWNSLLNGFDKVWYHAAVRDNAAFATDTYVPAFADTDGDGMPDWWEEAMVLDPLSPSGEDGDSGDPDGDGLSNFYEFLAGTNPFDADTDHDAINDFNADSDGDGLSNGQEQQAGTLPGATWISPDTDPTDTDDDGVGDAAELAAGTNPVKAGSPDQARSMQFNGSGRLVVRKEQAYDASLGWTVEAWVKPVGSGTDGILLRRAEKFSVAGQEWVDYELGIAGGKPYISYAFRAETGHVVVRVDAPKALKMNQWSHVAAVRDPATLQTRLYVNGKCVERTSDARLPATALRGVFETVMGEGLVGELDAVRVWNYVRTSVEIQDGRDVLLPEANLDGTIDKNRAPKRLFNFDDGGTTAENSYYVNDWMTGWQNAAVLEGDAAFKASAWAPLDLDSDDDASTDVDERSGNTLVLRSESPYSPRALKFGGLGSVLADEQVDGKETMLFAISNWTVEAWVKPAAAPAGPVSLVKRATLGGGSATFELGLDSDLSAYAGFDREDAGHAAFHVDSGDKLLPTNEWTHLAATYSAADNRLILYINGVEQIRGTDTAARPVVERAGRLLLGSAGFEGELKEIRVWNKARTPGEVYANFSKTLLFSVALLENSFRATGDTGNRSYLGRVTKPIENGYDSDHSVIAIFPDAYNPLPYVSGRLTHKFTLETWIRMQPGAAGGRAVTRQIDVMLVDNGSDWRVTEALVIATNGAPVVEWWGQVNAATPIYEEEETKVIDENGKTNTVKRKMLSRLEYTTSLIRRSLVSEVDIRDGQWHHLAAVGDSQRVRLYVDGELNTESLSYYVFKAIPAPSFETYYWQYSNAGSALRISDETLQADLDEVMYWNEDRTEAEIQKHMQYGLTASEIELARLPISPVPEFAIDDATQHVDLVSYMIFDGTPPLPFVVDAANEALNYRILADANGDEILRNSRPPVFVDRLRALKDDLPGYFAADDGGESAENFMKRGNLGYSGLLNGDAEFVAAPDDVTVADSDGDGLPDGWESDNGLDEGDPDGVNGAYGDADGDGLSNVAEFLAGTDPNNWDTDGDGTSDYDSFDPLCVVNCVTFGEYYMDGDHIPDAWEILYPDALSPLVNDANTDPDGDGWSNLAEYLGSGIDRTIIGVTTNGADTNATTEVEYMDTVVSPTRPNDAASYPIPAITFTFLGNAATVLGEDAPLTVWAFSDPAMRKPDAVTVVPFSGVFANGSEYTVTQWASGHLRQGANIFMAFIDANADGKWNAGEWLGYSDNGTENVQWGSSQVRIALTDKPAGYIRFSWEQDMAKIAAGLSQVNGTTYIVAIKPVMVSTPIYSATRNLESMDRPYITEMDLKQAGIGPMYGGYEWSVGTPDGTAFASGTNSILYPALTAPTIHAPDKATLVHAQNTLELTLSKNAAQVGIQILRGGSAVLSTTLPAPALDANGRVSILLPWLAGWGSFTNGEYTLQVTAINPLASASAGSTFSVNLQPAPIGAGTIKGKLGYFGTNLGSRVVEAFVGAGFDQTPAARAKVAADGTYVLLGLRPGTYSVRGYVDANGNGSLDVGEAWGFLKAQSTSVSLATRRAAPAKKAGADPQSSYAVEYTVKSVAVSAQGSALGQDVIAYDSLAYRRNTVDSDGDGLTDDLELLRGTNPMLWDSDFDGLGDSAEINRVGGATDPTNPDTDGDGMPDGWEEANSLNPLIRAAAGQDTDDDGVPDVDEYNRRTNPRNPDTDGDGMPDGYEVEHNFDPLVADADADADNDGVPNGQELLDNTDPNRSDSDDDGLNDGQEKARGTDPNDWDSDNDGYSDGVEDAGGSDPLDDADVPSAGRAQTQITRITAGAASANVVYGVVSLSGPNAILEIMVNDNLMDGAGWTVLPGFQRVVTSADVGSVRTNTVPDQDADGILNIRIRSR